MVERSYLVRSVNASDILSHLAALLVLESSESKRATAMDRDESSRIPILPQGNGRGDCTGHVQSGPCHA